MRPATSVLGVRMQARRRVLDGGLVALAAIVSASVLWDGGGGPRVTVALCSGLSVLVFCARARQPLAVTIASFGLQAVSLALVPSSTLLQFVASLFTFALAGAVNRGRDLVVVSVVGVAFLAYATLGLPTSGGFSDFALSTLIAMGFLVAGWQVSRRGRLLVQARDTADAVEARHRERTRRAVIEERARIARELHDVVSHGLSVVVVQTQAARSAVEDGDPDETQVVGRLTAVEETAREALGDMRRMLGLLQVDAVSSQDVEPEVLVLGDLSMLVDRARAAGCRVTADLPEPAPQVPAGIGLATYRIVQESVTNVLKYAPGADLDVCVEVDRDLIGIRVRNTMSGPSAEPSGEGHGLVGMRERASMYGGQFTAGVVDGRFFEVVAQLPLTPDTTAGSWL